MSQRQARRGGQADANVWWACRRTNRENPGCCFNCGSGCRGEARRDDGMEWAAMRCSVVPVKLPQKQAGSVLGMEWQVGMEFKSGRVGLPRGQFSLVGDRKRCRAVRYDTAG